WSYCMVYLDPSRVEAERLFPLPERRDSTAREAVMRLFDAIDCGSELGVEETLARTLELLLGRPDPGGAAPRLSKVRERIDAGCCEALRLHELAALAGVSPTRLARAFEAAYGLTP